MPKPPPKPARPVSSRATVARPSQSTVGLSAAMVRASLVRPLNATELAQQAQAERYQQIIRSGKAFARQLPVARQDGPVAYHAQARARAELKYNTQTNAWQARERAAVQYFAAKQTYISQGERLSASEIAERSRQTQLIIARQKFVEHIQATNSPQIANMILHDVVLRSTAEGALTVVGPELAVARLTSVARLIGGVRAANAVVSASKAYTYPALNLSRMTWATAGQASRVFATRAATDIGLQYTGAAIYKLNMKEAALDVNYVSAFMAGLPGDSFVHSVRNGLVGNAFELKLTTDNGFNFGHMGNGAEDWINYGQKVSIGLAADYLSGRYSGYSGPIAQKRRALILDRRRALPHPRVYDPQVFARYKYRFQLLTLREQAGIYGIKLTSGIGSSFIESYLKPASPSSSAPSGKPNQLLLPSTGPIQDSTLSPIFLPRP